MFVESAASWFSQRESFWVQIWFVQTLVPSATDRWLPELWRMEHPHQAQDHRQGSNGLAEKKRLRCNTVSERRCVLWNCEITHTFTLSRREEIPEFIGCFRHL